MMAFKRRMNGKKRKNLISNRKMAESGLMQHAGNVEDSVMGSTGSNPVFSANFKAMIWLNLKNIV